MLFDVRFKPRCMAKASQIQIFCKSQIFRSAGGWRAKNGVRILRRAFCTTAHGNDVVCRAFFTTAHGKASKFQFFVFP
jgi:hypothetical protein